MTGFNLHLTLANVWLMLNGIVEREGADRIGMLPQGGCAYVSHFDGFRAVPSCIVGMLFADLGVLRVLLAATGPALGETVMDGTGCSLRNLGTIGNPDTRARIESFGITFDEAAWSLLAEVQGSQDSEFPWGEALDAAAQWMVAEGHASAPPVHRGNVAL